MKNSDLIGLKVYRWEIVGPLVGFGARKGKKIWCACSCGSKRLIDCWALKNDMTKSCGCYSVDKLKERKIHGMSHTRVWNCWTRIMQRCNNVNNRAYKNYGGRGIKVCKRWENFTNFHKDMGNMPVNKSIGRINNSGDYKKSNCRWETTSQQNRNYRRNHTITHKSKTMCAQEWAELVGIKASVIIFRLRSGWSVQKSLSEPVRKWPVGILYPPKSV